MAKIFVSRSVWIENAVDDVFAAVRDFRRWPEWSPWLIADSKSTLEFGDDQYSWVGPVCGSGGMSVTGEEAEEWIDYDLVFLKPFRSKAKVRMEFAERNGGTEVTWTMDSELPFFLFWMVKSMEAFIGMDYERGLKMLKELLEKGAVNSRVSAEGREAFAGLAGVGLQRTCGMNEMPQKMGEDFARIRKDFPEGTGFSVCHRWEVVKQSVTYFIGMSVETVPETLPAGLSALTVPPLDVYVVRHFGSYEHLGNGWATGMMHGRSRQFRHSRKFPPFEIYETHDDENAVVKICLPMK